MSIAIICPTRGRQDGFSRMVKSVKNTTSSDVSVIAGTNGDDDYVGNKFPIDCPTAHMWNVMGTHATIDFDLIMVGSDDMYFVDKGWDKTIKDHYNSLENKIHVYALQDSRDEYGAPHPIMTKEYVKKMGYFVPPIFMHWCIDSWTVEIAKANNCFTHLRDYQLVHDKPSDSGNPDETHKRIRSNGWHVRDMNVAKSCGHFLELEKQRLMA